MRPRRPNPHGCHHSSGRQGCPRCRGGRRGEDPRRPWRTPRGSPSRGRPRPNFRGSVGRCCGHEGVDGRPPCRAAGPRGPAAPRGWRSPPRRDPPDRHRCWRGPRRGSNRGVAGGTATRPDGYGMSRGERQPPRVPTRCGRWPTGSAVWREDRPRRTCAPTGFRPYNHTRTPPRTTTRGLGGRSASGSPWHNSSTPLGANSRGGR